MGPYPHTWQRAGIVIVIRTPGGHDERYIPAQLVRYEAAPKTPNQHSLIDGYALELHYDGGRVERFPLPRGVAVHKTSCLTFP